MAALSQQDREQFLAEPHIAALSVVAGSERGPFTLPIWYQYRPGEEAWILTEAESKKSRLIREAGRFSLMVNRIMPTNRYVSVEGPVSRVISTTPDLLLEITQRYLPDEQVQAYLDLASTFGRQIVVYMRPQRWLTGELGPGHVPPGAQLCGI